MDIIFATNNENKTREIGNILGDKINLLSLNDLNVHEDIPENGSTLEENALQKARYIYEKFHHNVFADDTGLEIDMFNGLPGVKSARFAGENKDSEANIDKVLLMMGDSEKRTARFRTVIALIIEGKEYLFEGIAEGRITGERRGTAGFGYDPVFIPGGEYRTFAEMPLDEKNKISHRARAFEKLRTFLNSQVRDPDKDTE
jgi:XTP/dITP diphosphohydrolase